MDVTDFLLYVLEFAAGTHNVVQQIPDFSLKKVLFEFITVENLSLEDELVVVVAQLC